MVNYDEEDRTYCIGVYKGCTIHADRDGYHWLGKGVGMAGDNFDSKDECIADINLTLDEDYRAICVERW